MKFQDENFKNCVTVKRVIYESATQLAQVLCEVNENDLTSEKTFLINHSDLNRIIAKLIAAGINDIYNSAEHIQLEDGNEIIDFDFVKKNQKLVILENFYFNNSFWQIRA